MSQIIAFRRTRKGRAYFITTLEVCLPTGTILVEDCVIGRTVEINYHHVDRDPIHGEQQQTMLLSICNYIVSNSIHHKDSSFSNTHDNALRSWWYNFVALYTRHQQQ